MAGRGANSGRGGRERQGAAQQRRQNNRDDLELSDSSSSEDEHNLQPNVNASRRSSYSLWTEEKMSVVLQAIIDTPRRMLQSPPAESGFDRVFNKSGDQKVSIDKLECVVTAFPICLCVIMYPNILFCSYGDMGKVIENTCVFLNGSASFLQLNKRKSIQLSTLKNKLSEWQRVVRSDRDSYAMGQEAFYDLPTHPESVKLTIQIVRMQDVALQRQDRERAQADPARNDNHLAAAVRVPLVAPQSQNAHALVAVQSQNSPALVAVQSQNAPAPAAVQSQSAPIAGVQYPDTVEGRFLAAQAHYAAQRAAARSAPRSNSSGGSGAVTIDRNRVEAALHHSENSQASHPAAVAPNTIQVWSGSHGSSNTRKRLMAVAGGDNVPTAQRPSLDGFLPNFIESAKAYRSAQETKSNAAMLGAATTFIEYARTLPIGDPMRQDLLNLGVRKAREILHVNHADAPVLPVQPPEPPVVQPPAFEPLQCTICLAHFELHPVRGTYKNVIFTLCQHAFHPACLAAHRRTQNERIAAAARWIDEEVPGVRCPNCNEELPEE
jgi:hypothetical protein